MVGMSVRVAIEFNGAGSGDDFHAFGFISAEVEFSRIDQAQGFLGLIREEEGMADDAAVEVDIGFCDGSDIAEFGWDIRHGKGVL